MADEKLSELTEELRQFQQEKEKIRRVVGQIGGASSIGRERVITIVFGVLLFVLFCADLARHYFGLPIPLPPLFSIGLGILLVSAKIIWMIQKQAKVEHFQFWILNSIEFRLDQISNRLRDIESDLRENKDGI